jgi:hypothetical protein
MPARAANYPDRGLKRRVSWGHQQLREYFIDPRDNAGIDRNARQGAAWLGLAGHGEAWRGAARGGKARRGRAWPGRPGAARRGEARGGLMGQDSSAASPLKNFSPR